MLIKPKRARLVREEWDTSVYVIRNLGRTLSPSISIVHWKTTDDVEQTKKKYIYIPRENEEINGGLLNERTYPNRDYTNKEKKKKPLYIIYIYKKKKDTFNILPIVRGVLSGNTYEKYIGVHKRTFFFFSCATHI